MIAPAPHQDSEIRSARTVYRADEEAAGGAKLIDAAEAYALPTSLGVFKPVPQVMMGLPPQAQPRSDAHSRRTDPMKTAVPWSSTLA